MQLAESPGTGAEGSGQGQPPAHEPKDPGLGPCWGLETGALGCYKVMLNSSLPSQPVYLPPRFQDVFCSKHLQTLNVKLKHSMFLILKKESFMGSLES